MRLLYQFPTSVFSRRTRLALAHKGLDCELRDARRDAAAGEEMRRLNPLATAPVLVDDDRVIGDSTAIAAYLDVVYPDSPALVPRARDAGYHATRVVSQIDLAMNTLADVGTRYYALRNDPAWADVSSNKIRRAQAAIDAVTAHAAGRVHLAGDAWSIADIWAYSAATWVAGMPARAKDNVLVAQILTLGFVMPDALVAWAKQHDGRADVRSVYGS